MEKEKVAIIPLDKRAYLSLEEATVYTGLDTNMLKKLSDGNYNAIVLWVGKKRLLKREMLEEYLENGTLEKDEKIQE